MRFILWVGSYAVALAVAAWLFDGISFAKSDGDWSDKLIPLLGVGLILGVITSVVKPIVKVLSFPIVIVTLGLFLLVINALMLQLTAWVSDKFDLGFTVEGFWTAVGGSIVITLVTWGLDNLVDDDERR